MSKYYEGKPCKNCANTKKYKSTRSCVHCMSLREIAPETRKGYWLKAKYGLSLAEYDTILANQNHECAICGSKEKLHVDHNHETGKIRGMLCHSCNVSLGHFRDDVNVLRRAIEYLND